MKLLGTFLILALSNHALSAQDLTPWSPPAERPVPKERLKGTEWSDRWVAALEGVSRDLLAKDTRPEFSLKLVQVFAGSQAKRLGLKVDDRLISWDDMPVLGIAHMTALRLETTGKLKVWSAISGLQDLQIEKGRLGVMFLEEWLPELAYVRSKDRDVTWDDYLFAATTAYQKDPLMAETALYRAHKGGFRGWLLEALMAKIAYDNGRFEEAMTFGWFAKDTVPPAQRGVILDSLFQAALLSGRIDTAAKVTELFPNYRLAPEWTPEFHRRRHARLDATDRHPLSPLEEARQGKFQEVPLAGLDINGESTATMLRRNGKNKYTVTAPAIVQSNFGPVHRDAYFAYEARLEPAARTSPYTAPSVGINLVDLSNGGIEMLASVGLNTVGQVNVMIPDLPTAYLAGSGLFSWDVNRVEIAVHGPWCEIAVNGQTVFYGIVADYPDRQLALSVQDKGVTIEVSRISVRHFKGDGKPPRVRVPGPKATDIRVPEKPTDAVLAWYHEALVRGYLDHGRRDAKWDQLAVDALGAAGPFLKCPSDQADVYRKYALAGRAIDAGCDDPIVEYVHAYLQLAAMGGTHPDILRGFKRAAGAIRSTDYPAILKCAILMGPVVMAENFLTYAMLERGVENAEKAFEWLPTALKDKDAPVQLLEGVLLAIAKHLKGYYKSPVDAFDRVFSVANKLRPETSSVFAFKGAFYTDLAWKARGSGWAKDVTEEGWKGFGANLEVAAEALEKSWKLDPSSPSAPARMTVVALGHAKTRADIKEWMERAIKADPNALSACQGLLSFLMPRWHGSEEQLLEFGRAWFKLATETGLRPEMVKLLLAAHETITYSGDLGGINDTQSTWNTEEYWRRREVWEDVKKTFDAILKQCPDSVYYRSSYAAYAARCFRWKEAKEQFDKLGADVASEPFGGPASANKARLTAADRGK